jgi:hypothetical protein
VPQGGEGLSPYPLDPHLALAGRAGGRAQPKSPESQPDTQVPLGGGDHLTAQPEQDPRTIERDKQQIRDRIWALLEREAPAKPPGRAVGKIPNFLGAAAAADQLAALPAWEAAHVVKANPDKAQRAVRARALTEGKVLYMAVPRLADALPFYLTDADGIS